MLSLFLTYHVPLLIYDFLFDGDSFFRRRSCLLDFQSEGPFFDGDTFSIFLEEIPGQFSWAISSWPEGSTLSNTVNLSAGVNIQYIMDLETIQHHKGNRN